MGNNNQKANEWRAEVDKMPDTLYDRKPPTDAATGIAMNDLSNSNMTQNNIEKREPCNASELSTSRPKETNLTLENIMPAYRLLKDVSSLLEIVAAVQTGAQDPFGGLVSFVQNEVQLDLKNDKILEWETKLTACLDYFEQKYKIPSSIENNEKLRSKQVINGELRGDKSEEGQNIKTVQNAQREISLKNEETQRNQLEKRLKNEGLQWKQVLTQLNEKESQIKELVHKLNNLSSALKNEESRRRNEETRRKQLEKQLNDVESQKKELVGQLNNLSSQLKMEEARTKQLEKQLNDVESQKKELVDMLNNLSSQLKMEETRRKQLEKQLNDVESQKKELVRQLNNLSSQLKMEEARKKYLAQELTELKQQKQKEIEEKNKKMALENQHIQAEIRKKQEILRKKSRYVTTVLDTRNCHMKTYSIDELRQLCLKKLAEEKLETQVNIMNEAPEDNPTTIVVSFMSYSTGRWDTSLQAYTMELLKKFGDRRWFGVLLERVGESTNITSLAKCNTIVAHWQQDETNPTLAVITKESMDMLQQRICSLIIQFVEEIKHVS
jgi:myosin heavy subunit